MGVADGSEKTLESEETEYRYERAPDERPSEAVIIAVAKVAGRSALPSGDIEGEDETNCLSPLYEHIDPDALDVLVTTDDSTNCAVTFTYGDYTVTIRKWVVTVTPAV